MLALFMAAIAMANEAEEPEQPAGESAASRPVTRFPVP